VKLVDVYKDLLQVFATVPANASTTQRDRALNDINATVQQMQAAGEDFYGREQITVGLTGGQAVYQLDQDVQTVLEPVSLLDGRPLRRLTSRGQLISFGPLFLGQLAFAVAAGRPLAYYVFPLRNAADQEDSVTIKLQLVPAPSVAEAGNSLKLEVIKRWRI
jgi:hypothetical protein